MLNCCTDDVETGLTVRYNETDSTLEITSQISSAKTQNTVNLLDKIHNGIDTKSFSFVDLRRLIAEELAELTKEIEYFETTVLKTVFKGRIKKRLSRAPALALWKEHLLKTNIRILQFYLIKNE